jgi:hypothetical protein
MTFVDVTEWMGIRIFGEIFPCIAVSRCWDIGDWCMNVFAVVLVTNENILLAWSVF